MLKLNTYFNVNYGLIQIIHKKQYVSVAFQDEFIVTLYSLSIT